ncbi:MAG: hypothetical protein H7177_06400 [Rhizobacter sp.]|nr:hypothetical protein [Bacteriovorax sp.]
MPTTKTTTNLEPVHGHSHLLCWRSVFAGILISLMSYMLLSSLGAGILGLASQAAIENESGGMALATGTGLWMGISAVVSLFAGSYFAVRISKNITNKVGTAHGLVVASSFFIIVTVMASSAVGSLSMGLGHLVSGMGQGAASVGANPRVQDTINNVLGTSASLKQDPKIVSEGIATRLLAGDVESAKAYYAYQSGQTVPAVSAKIDRLQAEFTRVAKEVGEKAAAVIAGTGLSLFVTFLVGFIAAGIGGRVGAHSNAEKPLTAEDAYMAPVMGTTHTTMFANQRGSALPYVFGWLLGVPASILFLIFALRTVF